MTQAPRHDSSGPLSRAPAPDSAPDPAEQPDTKPPNWLTEDAHTAWDAAVALLTSVRIVAKSDLTALARYCQYLSEWIALTNDINERGHILEIEVEEGKTPRGRGVYTNPAVMQRDAIERSIRSLEKALGLDPASYLDLTRDLNKALTDRKKVKGGRRVGGFLNTDKK